MRAVNAPHWSGTSLLRTPTVRAIKRRLRDAWWTARGVALSNPPLPDRIDSMLFVCLGNICRSPFAALQASARLEATESGAPVRCASAGIRTQPGGRAPADAVAAAADFGLSLANHRPQALTRELVAAYDLIVVMEAAQLLKLRGLYPEAAARLVLLSLFDAAGASGYQRYHIEDPFSQPKPVFDDCYRRIDRALSNLLPRVRSGSTRP